MKTLTKSKKLKILKASKFLTESFKIKVGDKYEIVKSQMNEDKPSKMTYLIYTKNKKAIVVYNEEVEVL